MWTRGVRRTTASTAAVRLASKSNFSSFVGSTSKRVISSATQRVESQEPWESVGVMGKLQVEGQKVIEPVVDYDSLKDTCAASKQRVHDFMMDKQIGNGLWFSQMKTGFSHYHDDRLMKEAKKLFPEEMASLLIDQRGMPKGVPRVRIVPASACPSQSRFHEANREYHVFVGGPAAVYSAAAAAKLGKRVLFVNDGHKGIWHGSARVNHTEETQQNEHYECYSPSGIAKYMKRTIKLDSDGFDWHYLRVDAMGPGTFDSIENFRNWCVVMGGMTYNIIHNRLEYAREGRSQWFDDLVTTKMTAPVLRWLQEGMDDRVLLEGQHLNANEPRGMGPYIFMSKGKSDIEKRREFIETLAKFGVVHQEISDEDMMSYFSGRARADVLRGELKGWTVPGNGLINPHFEKILGDVIVDNGGDVLQDKLKTVFVDDEGNAVGIELDDGGIIGCQSANLSLGNVHYILGTSDVTKWQSIRNVRNPVGISVPGTGVSMTGLSVSRGEEPPIVPTTGLTNYHRNMIGSRQIGPNEWATLWRATAGGNVGGPILGEKDGERVETYPPYYLCSEWIADYLFGDKYEAEGIVAASACPRELSSDEKPTLYRSGSNFFVWKGWQGLGVERPPSVAFQPLVARDPELAEYISERTGFDVDVIRNGKLPTRDMTSKILKASKWC